MSEKPKFPEFAKKITDFLEDEDGNITRNKLVTIGTMIMLMSIMYSRDVFAGHSSHVSHSSHQSGSGGGGGYHSSHVSHESHESHQSYSTDDGGGATGGW